MTCTLRRQQGLQQEQQQWGGYLSACAEGAIWIKKWRINIRPTVAASIWLILLLSFLLASKIHAEEPDIYSECDSLWSRIQILVNSPVAADAKNIGSSRWPDGYEITEIGGSNILISPPDIEGIPHQTSWFYQWRDSLTQDSHPIAESGIKIADSMPFLDDSIPIPLEEWEPNQPNALYGHLGSRIIFYRTLSFPPEYRLDSTRINWHDINLRFHHRRLDSLKLSEEDAMRLLLLLAIDKVVYSGMIEMQRTEGEASAQFYILIVDPKLEFRHLIHATETYLLTVDTLAGISLSLDFFPYIPTSHLKSLYGDHENRKP